MSSDITHHDENTLMKVHKALAANGLEGQDATDVIGDMQNEGILFRERASDEEIGSTSDGFHTFGELYDHRRALTAFLAVVMTTALPGGAWRSKQHHPDDGPMFEGGYFIVGLKLPTGTITYHYKLTHWDDFQNVPELPHAPKWDGATPNDTVHRLLLAARAEPTEA